MLYKTSAGTVSVRAGDKEVEGLLEPSHKALKITSWVGMTLIVLMLLVVLSGIYQEEHLPLFFIPATFIVFVLRGLDLFAKRSDRRRLEKLEDEGRLVIVPEGLLTWIRLTYARLGKPMPDHLFDYNFPASLALVKLYRLNRKDPKMNTQIGDIIDKCPTHVPEA